MSIETDVVPDDDYHYYYVKQSMKTARTTIDFVNDKVTMLDQVLNLCFISSGHYTIGITKEQQENTSEELGFYSVKRRKIKER